MDTKDTITLADLIAALLQRTTNITFETLQSTCLPVTLRQVRQCYLRGFEHRDLLQEANIVLWKLIDRYDIKNRLRFRPFYKRCLINHFNTLVRDQLADKRALNQSVYSLESVYEHIGVELDHGDYADAQPEDQVIAREALASYRVGLSTFEKKVFRLFLDHQSYEDMSDQLDATETQVRDACYRCRKKFKKILKRHQKDI